MGKKLDALLGRSFKTYKFKPIVNLSISRLSVLKNQRQSRCSLARSDVVQLLQQGHQDRALLRVEQVIKEQNMLDVFVMLEGYCNLVIERVHLIEQERECPEELKEAISGLLFASSRCGEFPELLEIRAVFQSRYGKELAARAIELRNNCGVNTKLIQKLSTRQPDLESRMKAVKEIAAENGIALQLEEQNQVSGTSGNEERFSESTETRQKYKGVADAAQAAFESAAYAAAAARAAVELSRSDSPGPDNQNSPRTPRRRGSEKQESDTKETGSPTDVGASTKEMNQSKKTPEVNTSVSASVSNEEDSEEDEVDPVKLLEKEIVLKDSDDESDDSSSAMNHSRDEGSSKQIPSNLRSGLENEVGMGQTSALATTGIKGKKTTSYKQGTEASLGKDQTSSRLLRSIRS